MTFFLKKYPPLEVIATRVPAQRGGLDDPSWPEYFEVEKVIINNVDLTDFLYEVAPEFVEKLPDLVKEEYDSFAAMCEEY